MIAVVGFLLLLLLFSWSSNDTHTSDMPCTCQPLGGLLHCMGLTGNDESDALPATRACDLMVWHRWVKTGTT